jgi:8-oxo-dGTP pyrophosphatase MutT (NUDIX family)
MKILATDRLKSGQPSYFTIDEARAAGKAYIQKRIQAGRESGQGAGALLQAKDTGRFLLLLRSETGDHAGEWCNGGGGVEPGESPDEAVRREYDEETGYGEDMPCDLHYIGEQTAADNFRFHNFIGVIPTEYSPVLNDEHTDHQWVEWEDFPENTHPCMMEAINSPTGRQLLEQHCQIPRRM